MITSNVRILLFSATVCALFIAVSGINRFVPKNGGMGWERQEAEDFEMERQTAQTLRQVQRNYWEQQLGALQRQLFPAPTSVEEKVYNAKLQRQMGKVMTMAESDFIFGLNPYLKMDGQEGDQTVTKMINLGLGAGGGK